MVPVNPVQKPDVAEIAVIENRVAIALAKHERLVKSWTASSHRSRPPQKTQEELVAEDSDLFRIEPPTLGLGAPIPKEFLNGDIKRKEISGNDNLKRLLMGKRAGLQASKPRDLNEKAGSAKRGLKEESSDDEEGRSALGKAKKSKVGINSPAKHSVTNEEAKTAIKEAKLTLQESEPALQNDVKPAVRNSGIPSPRVAPERIGKPQFKSAVTPKKCLVDYSSDEDDGGDGGEFTNQALMESTPQKAVYTKPCAYDIPDGMNPPANTLSNSASGLRSMSSSKSSMASSESDQSELEMAIPVALTPDVVAPVSLHKNNLSDEAKRAKKRLKRARRKEREQQLKALAQNQTIGGPPMQAVAPTNGPIVLKKLKDRLLDANGN